MLIYRSYGDRGKSQIYNFNLVLEIKNFKIFSVASHITIFYHRESRQHWSLFLLLFICLFVLLLHFALCIFSLALLKEIV